MTNDQPEERPPLTRERILAAAVAFADEHGTDGLSMRKLAKQLDYEVMSLYNHVVNKDDLLAGMVDIVVAEIVESEPELGWKAAVREIAMSAHDALIHHRWASALWTSTWPGPNRWRYMEVLLRHLADAGFPDDLADLGFHAVTLHIQGFTQQQINYSMAASSDAEMFDRFRREVSAEEYPFVVDHVRYHQVSVASQNEFGFVLDLILDGLERAGGAPAR